MNLSDSPRRPACPSRASRWSSLTTPWGLPCCVRFPCVHAAASTPVQQLGVFFARLTQLFQPSPIWQSGRPAHRPFRGLLSVYSRCGLHTCAVTNSRHANRRLQPLRCLHDCSDCFRLERLPGGVRTHWKAPPFHGAHPERTSALREPGDPHPFIDDAFDLGGMEGIELPSTLALPLRSDLRSAGRLRRLVELTNDVQHPRLFL